MSTRICLIIWMNNYVLCRFSHSIYYARTFFFIVDIHDVVTILQILLLFGASVCAADRMQKLSYYFLHPQDLIAALRLPRRPSMERTIDCYIRNKE